MREPRLRRHPRLLRGSLKPRPIRVPRHVERWVWLSRLLQFVETLLPALWPALGVAALFVTLSFLDAWRFVSPGVQGVIVTGFMAAIVGLGYLGLNSLRFPGRKAGLRRLELDSGLAHRPLSGFEDKPATNLNDPVSRKLWAAHQARQSEAWKRLELERHDEALVRRDPLALRVAAVLAVVISGVAAGPDWDERLGAALMPRTAAQIDGLRADLWVMPPEYTGAAPVFLTGEAAAPSDKSVKVPAGSVVTARVAGTSRTPRLRADPKGDGKRIKGEIAELDDGVRESRLTLDQDARVTFRVAGRTMGRWTFEVTPDQAPSITVSEAPKSTLAGTLELTFRASDDYGVVSAEGRLTLVPHKDEYAALESAAKSRAAGQAKKGEGSAKSKAAENGDTLSPDFYLSPAERVTLPFSLTEGRAKEVEQKVLQPLADHPWAGREVRMQLVARDDADNEGYSKPVKVVLAERPFSEPLAQALIEQRKTLAADPYAYPKVAKVLGALLVAPERFYDDKVVFLGLKSAHWRLTHNPRTENLESVYDLLWDLAIRIEDGDLALAKERLRQAQEALKQALRDGASEAELRRLMAELREAVSAYIQALMESGKAMAELPEGMADSLSNEDLSSLLDKLEQLAETGAREAAQDLLSDLAALLENLQIVQGSGGGLSESEQAMSEAIDELGELLGEQRKLLDETFRGAQGKDEPSSFEEQFNRSFDNGGLFLPREPEQPRSLMPDAGPGENRGPERFKNAPGDGGFMTRRPDRPGATPMPGVPDPPDSLSKPPEGTAPTPDIKSGSELAREQNAVREKLKELMENLRNKNVQVPENLGDAGEAMGDARDRLAQDDYGGALPPEREAIEKLREGSKSLAQDLTERLSKRQALGFGGSRGGRDPLGRRPGSQGFAAGDSVKVPDESALQEARRILEELRRRAAERGRPEEELEYLDRLLKRF